MKTTPSSDEFIAMDGHQVELIVKTISEETGRLIEIVNYNVQGQQYVCAGDVGILPSYAALCSSHTDTD
jgi:malonyl CoA-acyl carrier protein transacylase